MPAPERLRQLAAAPDPRSGLTSLLFLSPGIQYLPIPQMILEGSVQVPIHRDLNGRQVAPDWSAVVGLRYLF